MWITVGVLFVLAAVYLFCLKPNVGRGKQMAPFTQTYIAHRGLFDNDTNAVENSIAAFRRAVIAGYGIELDVQLTADNKLVVFHDKSLLRMCGVEIQPSETSYEELKQYSLLKSNEKIPLFSEVLAVVAGRVPMIIEIKPEGNPARTAEALARSMENYQGDYCIESFHPQALRWYRKNRPEVLRGQLSENFVKVGWQFVTSRMKKSESMTALNREASENKSKNKNKNRKPGAVNKDSIGILKRILLANLLFNFYGKPDFIAYHHRHSSQFSYSLCRKLYKPVNAAWTIRSEKELEESRKIYQIVIFDSFIPEKNRG